MLPNIGYKKPASIFLGSSHVSFRILTQNRREFMLYSSRKTRSLRDLSEILVSLINLLSCVMTLDQKVLRVT